MEQYKQPRQEENHGLTDDFRRNAIVYGFTASDETVYIGRY